MHRFLLFFTLIMFFSYSSEAQEFDWALEIESSIAGDAYCYGITYNSDQDCSYVLGKKDYNNFFIRKISAVGTMFWQNDLGTYINGVDITHDNQGNVYVVGEFISRADLDPSPNPADTFFLNSPFTNSFNGPADVFVLKIDSSGQFIWATMVARSGECSGSSIEVDANENVYIAGVLSGTNFVQKFDSQGNSLWQHELGTCSFFSFLKKNKYDKDIAIHGNHIYIAGNYEGSADMDPSPSSSFMLQSNGDDDNFLVKLDLNGNFIWANSFGYDYIDQMNAISVDFQGNIYTAGVYIALDSILVGGTYSARFGVWNYLRKQDSQGQELWINKLPQEILAMDASQNGYLYTTGKEATSVSNVDIIIQKWETNNTLLWNQQIFSPYYDEGLDIAVDMNENVYTVGYFEGIVDFDLSSAIYYLQATGRSDGFVLKLAPQTIAIPYVQNLEGVRLYPNPTRGIVSINLEEVLEEGRLELISSSGQIYYRAELDSNNFYELDLGNYPSGIYMVRISSKEKTSTFKVVKE